MLRNSGQLWHRTPGAVALADQDCLDLAAQAASKSDQALSD